MAINGNAASPNDAACSVKNLKLGVSPNGQYFVDQNGKSSFISATLAGCSSHGCEELDEYLKDRAAKGFTVTQAHLLRGLDRAGIACTQGAVLRVIANYPATNPSITLQEFGGEGRNRTDECSFCRAVPYHLATPPPSRDNNSGSRPRKICFNAL